MASPTNLSSIQTAAVILLLVAYLIMTIGQACDAFGVPMAGYLTYLAIPCTFGCAALSVACGQTQFRVRGLYRVLHAAMLLVVVVASVVGLRNIGTTGKLVDLQYDLFSYAALLAGPVAVFALRCYGKTAIVLIAANLLLVLLPSARDMDFSAVAHATGRVGFNLIEGQVYQVHLMAATLAIFAGCFLVRYDLSLVYRGLSLLCVLGGVGLGGFYGKRATFSDGGFVLIAAFALMLFYAEGRRGSKDSRTAQILLVAACIAVVILVLQSTILSGLVATVSERFVSGAEEGVDIDRVDEALTWLAWAPYWILCIGCGIGSVNESSASAFFHLHIGWANFLMKGGALLVLAYSSGLFISVAAAIRSRDRSGAAVFGILWVSCCAFHLAHSTMWGFGPDVIFIGVAPFAGLLLRGRMIEPRTAVREH